MIERRTIVGRNQWLQWRLEDVTASVVGALFGVHPYCTALRIYAEKRGVEFNQEDTKTMRRGRWLEPAIAKAVSELRPDWVLESPNLYLRDPELHLGATPDFFIDGDPRGHGVLQAKSVSPTVYARDWDGGREPPLWITLQTLTEMMLAEAAFGVVAVLLVDPHQMDCAILDVPRNPSAEAKIIAAVRDFWARVDRGEEPEPDYGRDTDAIKALVPREIAGKAIDFTGNNTLPDLLAQRAQLKARIANDESQCDEIENELRFMMRDAEIATGLDGWRITYKTETRNYKAKEAYTAQSRVLRIQDKRPNSIGESRT